MKLRLHIPDKPQSDKAGQASPVFRHISEYNCDKRGIWDVKKAEPNYKYNNRFFCRSFHWMWNICILGCKKTPWFICYTISTVVHKYFCLWHSYANFCDSGGYCEADHPKKDERGNKFNGRISPINNSPTKQGVHPWCSGKTEGDDWNGYNRNSKKPPSGHPKSVIPEGMEAVWFPPGTDNRMRRRTSIWGISSSPRGKARLHGRFWAWQELHCFWQIKDSAWKTRRSKAKYLIAVP